MTATFRVAARVAAVIFGTQQWSRRQYRRYNKMEICDLTEKVRRPGIPPIIVEVGVAEGHHSKGIAEYLAKNGGHLVCVDWFEGSMVGDRYIIPKGLKGKFLEHTKDCNIIIVPHESGFAASLFRDKLFDVVWIDADHRYHAIKRDIELWLPKVRPGGILSGHDYDAEYFNEAYIEEDYVDGVHHGVTKAVNERFGKPERLNTTWWVQVKNEV